MDNLIGISTYGFIAATIALAVLLLRDSKDGTLKRFITALPQIHEAVVAWVARADKEYDQIAINYAERAEKTGRDPRLLWVIDQVRAFVKKQFKVDVDVEWLVNQIEAVVSRNKQ